MNFSQALKALADDESIDLKERDRKKLKRIAGNKRRCKRCEERAELEVRREGKQRSLKVSDGGYGDGYGFSWENLLSFLTSLLPLILSFIDALN